MIVSWLVSVCVMVVGLVVELGEYVYILGDSVSGMMMVKGDSFNILMIGGNCYMCVIEGIFWGCVGIDKDEGKCYIVVLGNKDVFKLDLFVIVEVC